MNWKEGLALDCGGSGNGLSAVNFESINEH